MKGDGQNIRNLILKTKKEVPIAEAKAKFEPFEKEAQWRGKALREAPPPLKILEN